MQNAPTFAAAHLGGSLTVGDLPDAACLSPGQFSGALAETSRSPAKTIGQLRVEAARVMTEQSQLSMNEMHAIRAFAILSVCDGRFTVARILAPNCVSARFNQEARFIYRSLFS